MRVLFVCSGNSKIGISPIVRSQGESLKHNKIEVAYFPIKGKGFRGYIKNIFQLRKYLSNNHYDLIHAHYSLSAICASFTFSKIPTVVSLMGSDIKLGRFWNVLIRVLSKYKWKTTIVKSERMKNSIGLLDALVIPNGVDFRQFKPIKKNIAQENIGYDPKKNHIIFVSNPDRYEKNFQLAQKAYSLVKDKNIELKVICTVSHNLLPYYYNTADVLLLTSLWEGSPNVIKEAMACNCPIVSTDVGDVKEVFGNTNGCYICSYDPEDVEEKIKIALDFGKRTNGRQRIIELGLDSDTVAQKIISVYKEVLNN